MVFLNNNFDDFYKIANINTDIFEQMHTGIHIYDAQARLVFTNSAFKNMYKIENIEVGINAKSIFITAEQGVMEVLKTGISNSCPSRSINGLYGAMYRFPIKDSHGNIIGCIAECISVALDGQKISALKNLIEEIEQSNSNSFVQTTHKNSGYASFDSIIGESATMRSLKSQGRKFAMHQEPILILGENGTGKDLIAQAIHVSSTRKDKNFIAINCAAIPTNLIEAELFGYEKGAFTGATRGKAGMFEAAAGGTVFLDEIGELPMDTQPKLLRVLENFEIRKLGSTSVKKVDFRLVSATNRDIEQMVKEGTFREDLFYRLNLFELVVPPLRERIADIPLLCYIFIQNAVSPERAIKIVIDKAVLSLFSRHKWRGNVRELRNIVTYALFNMQEDDLVLNITHLPERFFNINDHEFINETINECSFLSEENAIDFELPTKNDLFIKTIKKKKELENLDYLKRALTQSRGNKQQAAKILGISRSNLYKKMKFYGLL